MLMRCNNCQGNFQIVQEQIVITEIDGLEIEYFCCPSCKAVYVVFAANDEMKKMVALRRLLQRQIVAARSAGFQEKHFWKLMGKQSALIQAQEKLLAELKPRAKELLKEEFKC